MNAVTSEQATLANILRELMDQKGVDIHKIADQCGVTYQTVKNALDGNSVNARFINSLVESFELTEDTDMLRRVLTAYLLLQFPDDNGELLRKAGMIE